MIFHNFPLQIRTILNGHLMLLLCIAFYLIWWAIAFRPGGNYNIISTISIILAFITGIAGTIICASGLGMKSSNTVNIPNIYFIYGAIVLYFIMFFISSKFFHRQVTTELFLLIAWLVLEYSVLNVMNANDIFKISTVIILGVVSTLVFIINFYCYMVYYDLSGFKSYIDGMIPLIDSAVVMIIYMVLIINK